MGVKKLAAPSYLSAAQKKAWADLANEIGETLEPADWPLLEQAAICWAEVRAADRLVKKGGLMIEDRFGSPVPNPALKMREAAQKLLLSCFDRLGIGPKARQELGSGKRKEAPKPVKIPAKLGSMSAEELTEFEKRLAKKSRQNS